VPSPAKAEGTYENYRKRLSRYAASKVEAGDTIFVNGSTCALGLLDHLDVQNVHVITNNGLASTKKCPKGVTITLTGGELREHVMVGDSVMRRLLNETADKTFIGCAGITANGEFSYNIPMEIGINETMIARTTKELYILADHTKLENTTDNTARYGSCIYDRQVTLITDEKANPATVESLRKLGIEVYQVGLNDVNF
jgi:DeoR/GlpR family transcriptional regulator of sugar metabolism